MAQKHLKQCHFEKIKAQAVLVAWPARDDLLLCPHTPTPPGIQGGQSSCRSEVQNMFDACVLICTSACMTEALFGAAQPCACAYNVPPYVLTNKAAQMVGSMLNVSQQCALAATWANSTLGSISRSTAPL